MVGTVPLLLSIRAPGAQRTEQASLLRDLREGWAEFTSHTWLWATTVQFCVVLAAWYGAFDVLGPVVARRELGGPAAWGAIMAADAVGLIIGGLVALRFTPRRPILFVVLIGGASAISPLALAGPWPLPAVCAAAVGLGIALEIMMVQWTVTLARRIPAERLARVSSYDVLGSVLAMPVGALVVGPLAASIGVPLTEYGAAVLILVASLLALAPREVRSLRSDQAPRPGEASGPGEVPPEPGEAPRSGRDSGRDAPRVMTGS
jgi:MFS family permease